MNINNQLFSGLLCLVICLGNSCQVRHQDHLAQDSCDSSYHRLQATITDTGLTDAAVIKEIKNIYAGTPAGCRNALVSTITDDLFKRAYRSPLADTGLAAFYTEMSNDPALSGRNQLLVQLRMAAYYNYVCGDAGKTKDALDGSSKLSAYFDDTLSRSFYSLHAELSSKTGNMQEATTYYLKALQLAEQLKDSNSIAGISVNFANVYSKMQDFGKSIALRKKTEPWFVSRQDQNGIFICWMALGYDYAAWGKYDSAMVYNSKCAEMLDNGYQNPIVGSQLYNNISAIALSYNQFDTARFYFDKQKKELDKLEYNPETEMIFLMASTAAYAPVRDVSQAITKIREYIPVWVEKGNIAQARDAYYCLYHISSILDKPADALRYYQQWDSVKNVMAIEDNHKYVAELETKYQTAHKELTIQLQQKKIADKNTLNIMLTALLVAGGVAAAFIVSRVQLRRNRKEAAMQQQFTTRLLHHTEEERGRIARDLHDSVSQELLVLKNQVVSLSEPATRKIDTIINEIRMISRNLHPVMLDQIGLKHSIEHVCNRMMEHNHVFISSDITYHGGLDRNSELQLFRMIQEALNNTVKHAAAEAVKVSISPSDHTLITVIRDNGKGFDVDKALSGSKAFGLLNIIERSKSVQGKADISSGDKGTVITIEIPLSHV